jgi:hypothetical protein
VRLWSIPCWPVAEALGLTRGFRGGVGFRLNDDLLGDPRAGVYGHYSRDHPGSFSLVEARNFSQRRVASGYGTLDQARAFATSHNWRYLGASETIGTAAIFSHSK